MPGIRFGVGRSMNIREVKQRAYRHGISVEELLKKETFEQSMLNNGLRRCPKCGEWKKFTSMTVCYCKDCAAERTRARYNPERERAYWLKKKYGISIDEYNLMREKQGFKCAICGIHEDMLDRGLAVDHDHLTGKVRALLCGGCNRYLGQIQEDVEIAKRMVIYLEKYKYPNEGS